MKSPLDLIQASPFFEAFAHEDLTSLAQHAKPQDFCPDTVILRSGQPADILYMLVVGKVELLVKSAGDPSGPEPQCDSGVPLRTIGEPGRVIGWSAMVEPYHYRATVRTLQDTRVLTFDRDWLEGRAHERPQFGVQLMQRILWVLGNRLRESRIRLVARRYDQDTLAIRALIDQSAEQLNVTSPLHKVPFYLENRLTLSDAFHTLELLGVHGDELERSLAGLCLDILKNVRQELAVYHQLQLIYEHVANAPETTDPAQIRQRCCEDFIKLFEHTRYVIRGQHLLPSGPGHIVIMNHLNSHPDNKLPNEFGLTMDTHFVSSMILYKAYGQAPTRVVRKSHPDEYGHQRYYDRLGYIYVYAGHVDEDQENPGALAQQRRRLFLDAARMRLLDHENIVICPEGTCTATEESPLRFKIGAFRLASIVDPEPLIVPIAVANFDKKLTRTTLVAVVNKPFRLSDWVPRPTRDQVLFDFVNDFQKRFRGMVHEAVELADRRKEGA